MSYRGQQAGIAGTNKPWIASQDPSQTNKTETARRHLMRTIDRAQTQMMAGEERLILWPDIRSIVCLTVCLMMKNIAQFYDIIDPGKSSAIERDVEYYGSVGGIILQLLMVMSMFLYRWCLAYPGHRMTLPMIRIHDTAILFTFIAAFLELVTQFTDII